LPLQALSKATSSQTLQIYRLADLPRSQRRT
jgi:hypothetical protein